MQKQDLLIERLKKYSESGVYPFHMPGHKRQTGGVLGEFPNPFSIDITEIDGFDNLHHPEGILRESMDWTARIYGSDKSYYLINGSSGGILSAICASVGFNGRIIMARNCHKSAYHGLILKRIKASYVYPQILEKLWINGGILAEDVEELLSHCPEAGAVFLVSPTYEGIVSNIEEIARIVHRKGIPLIVDEAHGAHFAFGGNFPASALDCGADLVIQSLHKTLPCFTQTAILHVKSRYVDLKKLEWYLQVFQSSSPSYVLMAGIEQCIFEMKNNGRDDFERFGERLGKLRKELATMQVLKLLEESAVGTCGVYELDPSKIVVSCKDADFGGERLGMCLREKYGLEVEMCGLDYVVMITTVLDAQEGLDRLEKALLEIDRGLAEDCRNGKQEKKTECWIKERLMKEEGERGKREGERESSKEGESSKERESSKEGESPKEGESSKEGESLKEGESSKDRESSKERKRIEEKRESKEWKNRKGKERKEDGMTLADAFEAESERVAISECAGRISCEFVYLYPPGIPVIVPGERLKDSVLKQILEYKKNGFSVQGMEDQKAEFLKVCAESETPVYDMDE